MSLQIASFIDGAYLDKTTRSVGAGRVDLAPFSRTLAGGRQLTQTFYYDCLPYVGAYGVVTAKERANFDRKDRFFKALSYIPTFCIRLGRLAIRGWDEHGRPCFQQKRVDVYQSVDMAVLAAQGAITDAALVAGDSDIIPAVEAAQASGVRVHLFHGANAHRDLIAVCDLCTPMDAAFLAQFRFGSAA